MKDLLTTRTGGAYIPPAKLRLMQEQITDKASPAFQRLAWEALKKSINGSSIRSTALTSASSSESCSPKTSSGAGDSFASPS